MRRRLTVRNHAAPVPAAQDPCQYSLYRQFRVHWFGRVRVASFLARSEGHVMKLAELPQEVIEDLCGDRWRLDITPRWDSKHEFWMDWRHFLQPPIDLDDTDPPAEE